MRSPAEFTPPDNVHFRIWVYHADQQPPEGQPYDTSLCPWARNSSRSMTDNAAQVTCPDCRRHIDTIGIAEHM